MSGEVQKGLEGVVVAESQLSYIDGDEGLLIYRGHDIETLAADRLTCRTWAAWVIERGSSTTVSVRRASTSSCMIKG